jgi:hypothetical protein
MVYKNVDVLFAFRRSDFRSSDPFPFGCDKVQGMPKIVLHQLIDLMLPLEIILILQIKVH